MPHRQIAKGQIKRQHYGDAQISKIGTCQSEAWIVRTHTCSIKNSKPTNQKLGLRRRLNAASAKFKPANQKTGLQGHKLDGSLNIFPNRSLGIIGTQDSYLYKPCNQH